MGPPEIQSGDYELSMQVSRKKRFQKMHAEERCTEEICDGVKYGPNKFDLVKEWAESSSFDWEACAKSGDARLLQKLTKSQRQKSKRSKQKLSWNARKVRLYHVLRGVARRLHKKDLKIWISACGRFVSQKLGPIIYLNKKHIIQKLKIGTGMHIPKCDIIDVSKAGGLGTWALRPLKKKVPQQIESMMAEADSMIAPAKKIPRTVDDVEALLKAFCKPQKKSRRRRRRSGDRRGRKVQRPGSGYVKLWFFRAQVTRKLYLARRRLQLKKCTVARLMRIFPDQGKWLKKFCKSLGLNPQKAQAELGISLNHQNQDSISSGGMWVPDPSIRSILWWHCFAQWLSYRVRSTYVT